MKKLTFFFALAAVLLSSSLSFAQRTAGFREVDLDDGSGNITFLTALQGSLGINGSDLLPDPCALLDLTSTTKGFLPPRMNAAQVLLLCAGAPQPGMTIYNTSTNSLQVFNGVFWGDVSNGWTVEGNSTLNIDGVNNLLGSTVTSPVLPFNLIVGGTRIVRYEPNNRIIGGDPGNTILADNSVIAGGGVAGLPNSIADGVSPYSFIGAGADNIISNGNSAVIVGGAFNRANNVAASVVGGSSNTASGAGAFVGGGGWDGSSTAGNVAAGNASVIGGGRSNATTAGASYSTIGGGNDNEIFAIGNGAFIGGGSANKANAINNVIAGGYNSTNNGQDAFIGAGHTNIVNTGANQGVIAGGLQNTISGERSTISGGLFNVVTDDYGTVSGGQNNRAGDNAGTTADRRFATVGGGIDNAASGIASTIGGGSSNIASGHSSTVAGGNDLLASGDYSAIGGGLWNQATNELTVVAGGLSNTASGFRSTVGGGEANMASGTYSTVGGGISNNASVNRSTIGGGDNNIASNSDATVAGGAYNRATAIDATVGGGSYNTVAGNWSVIPGGNGMTLNGQSSFGFLGSGAVGHNQMTIAATHTAAFGNVHMWLANNNSTASQLRFYEPNGVTGAFPPAGINYTSFRAGAQGADITYTLPTANVSAAASATQLGTGHMEVNSAGTMSWRQTVVTTGNATFVATAAQSSNDQTIAVTGAASGDIVSLGVPAGAVLPNSAYTAWVSANDVVTIRFNNYSAGAQNPGGPHTFKVQVIK